MVESIGVGEEIKTRSGGFRQKIENYKQSIRNAARAGVKTFCYNFMAITDWTRTNINWPLANGGTALRFDALDYAAYDLFILERDGAEADYAPERIALAHARFKAMTPDEKDRLERALIDWLPARDFAYDRQSFKQALALYKEIERRRYARQSDRIRARHYSGRRGGGRAPRHPSRRSGFPDLRFAAGSVDGRRRAQAHRGRAVSACGITLCAGSFGSNPENDLVAMAREFGSRVHFAHLRNVKREADGSFFEADHLAGETDMVRLVAALMSEEERRQSEGRADAQIPMRPDHGHLLGDDGQKRVNPGYSFIGRLKGLAELRGVMQTVEAFRSGRVG